MAKKESPTRLAIIQAATDMFFETGFSKTTAAALCRKANIGTGNLTFYFPTKEHILDELVTMMCEFQWQMMEDAANEGKSSLLAYCLEITTMAAISEEVEQMHDFFVSAYTHPITLETIRINSVEKIKKVFGEYCGGWKEEHIIEAAAMISGIEYATLMTTKHSATMDIRVAGALNAIMMMFGVPEELRKTKTAKVLSMDYRALGRRLLSEFREYTREVNEKAVDEMLATYNLKK